MEVAASQPAPLQPDFVEWWFAPWSYAREWADDMRVPLGRVGQRDAYALWCEQAEVLAQFPGQVDGGWQHAAITSQARLEGIARLFAGLLAAREKDLKALQGLGADERRWCMSIAALQPLLSLAAGCQVDGAPVTLLQRGLLELRAWLEFGFPGMWSRLRHLLEQDFVLGLEHQPPSAIDPAGISAAAIRRAQRCWQLCADRALADAAGDDDQDDDEDEDGDEPRHDEVNRQPAPQSIKKRA